MGADVRIDNIKDFIKVPVISAGFGGVVSYMGGDVVGGMIAETLKIPETDVWGDAVCRGLTKLGIGAGGAFLASKTSGPVADAGAGMAIVGFTGFFSDLIEGALKARAPTTSTGTVLSRAGRNLVRGRRMPTGRIPQYTRAPSVPRMAAPRVMERVMEQPQLVEVRD